MILEVCVDSIQSVINAVEGGADRLELCSSLKEGGLSPTPAFLRVAKEYIKFQNVQLYCMLRPRGGPMHYSSLEGDIILGDIKDLKENGADGFVFGALDSEGSVDINLCQKVIKAANGLPCTFHRAFDLLTNPVDELETIISIGFKRILTSGCKNSAAEGASMIKQIVDKTNGRIVIMAGAGINSSNCKGLLKTTGVTELHCSAKVKKIFSSQGGGSDVKMGVSNDNSLYVTSENEVLLIKEILNT